MNLLFWNTNKKPLHNEIYDLVEEHGINLVLLAENVEEKAIELELVEKLSYHSDFKKVQKIIFDKIRVYYDDSIIGIREVHGHPRYGIFLLSLFNHKQILLAAVHFPSKINWGNSQDHFGLCVQLRLDIESMEDKYSINESMIIGDFNMNPFEPGLINASGLNNINVKSIALHKARRIYGLTYKAFYNPMWNFFGESSKGLTPGTYFYNTSKYVNQYWNIYDHLMMRPELLEYFNEDEFMILNSIKGKSLMRESNKIQIIDRSISDHLPLLAKFNLFKS